MKRRSFLQAVGGAIAAVFVPVVAAEQVKRLIAFPPPRLAMSLQEYNRVRPRFIFEPETVAELRAVIEANYETVHEFKHTPYEELLISGKRVEFNGPFYSGFVIAGEGVNEKEAVANAFNSITSDIGGKEMMWRRKLALGRELDFESNCIMYRVRGRVIELR